MKDTEVLAGASWWKPASQQLLLKERSAQRWRSVLLTFVVALILCTVYVNVFFQYERSQAKHSIKYNEVSVSDGIAEIQNVVDLMEVAEKRNFHFAEYDYKVFSEESTKIADSYAESDYANVIQAMIFYAQATGKPIAYTCSSSTLGSQLSFSFACDHNVYTVKYTTFFPINVGKYLSGGVKE